MELNQNQALFIYVNNILPPTGELISQIYNNYSDPDGFLYVQYSGENTFG